MFFAFFFLSRLTGIRGLYRGGCSWIQSGSFSSAVVSRCLVLNQISKHNMRSYKNVLMPAGGIELQPWHRQCLVRRKELLGQKKKKIDTNKNIMYIADKCDFQRNRKKKKNTIQPDLLHTPMQKKVSQLISYLWIPKSWCKSYHFKFAVAKFLLKNCDLHTCISLMHLYYHNWKTILCTLRNIEI